MNQKNGNAIIGFGEIGQSLASVYKTKGFNIMARDLNFDNIVGKVDILNICIPYSDQFVGLVSGFIYHYKPKLTIIHSSVRVGTTDIVTEKTGACVVHSPVMGVHPNLQKGIETFIKFIGYNNTKSLLLAEEHFNMIGIEHDSFFRTKSTEIAKLLSTTYYGLCISFHGEMLKLCKENYVSFDIINAWTENYNTGYNLLGMSNVQRPNLTPPSGGIGGHCVVPNVELLMKDFDSLALDLILKYKKNEEK